MIEFKTYERDGKTWAKRSDLQLWGRNPRYVETDAFRHFVGRLKNGGVQLVPCIALRDGTVINGNTRLRAYDELGWDEVWVEPVDTMDPKKAFEIAVDTNRQVGSWDEQKLAEEADVLDLDDEELEDLRIESGGDVKSIGDVVKALGPDGDEPVGSETLQERFIMPPFTVLDARGGDWIRRKKAWLSLGIRSELGRGEDKTDEKGSNKDAALIKSLSGRVPDYYEQKRAAEKRLGRKLSNPEFEEKYLKIGDGSGLSSSGTSVFDPVLCELVYRWFSPPKAKVLDPFAGGSVRGIVAAHLGREYLGIDLSEEQIKANRKNAEEIDTPVEPTWIVGDSREEVKKRKDSDYDLVFTCPPYYDLEVYGDRPGELSQMDQDAFDEAYREIINNACRKLKDNRFAAIVVGDVRNKQGNYRNFVSRTISAFIDAGLSLYNEAILVTPLGSVPVRAAGPFAKSRKLGKTHQNVLVFYKGDPKKISDHHPALSEDADYSLPTDDDGDDLEVVE